MSNIDFQNGFALGVASKGQAQGVAPNPLEYAVTFYQAFSGAIFPENYELTINVPIAINFTSLFQSSKNLVKLTVKGNTSGNVLNLNSTFRATNLVTLDLSEFNAKPNLANYTFYDDVTLKEIIGVLDFSECTSMTSCFNNCSVLEEVRFKENTVALSISFKNSPNLSVKSVQSIIDGLATVETAQTLTLNSAVAVSDTQKTTIQSKGWTLVQ